MERRLQKRLAREKKARKAGIYAAFITKPERKQGIAAAEVLWRVASAQGKAREKIFLL